MFIPHNFTFKYLYSSGSEDYSKGEGYVKVMTKFRNSIFCLFELLGINRGVERGQRFLTWHPVFIVPLYTANTCNTCAWKDKCAELAFKLFCWEKLVVQVHASRPQTPVWVLERS